MSPLTDAERLVRLLVVVLEGTANVVGADVVGADVVGANDDSTAKEEK